MRGDPVVTALVSPFCDHRAPSEVLHGAAILNQPASVGCRHQRGGVS